VEPLIAALTAHLVCICVQTICFNSSCTSVLMCTHTHTHTHTHTQTHAFTSGYSLRWQEQDVEPLIDGTQGLSRQTSVHGVPITATFSKHGSMRSSKHGSSKHGPVNPNASKHGHVEVGELGLWTVV